MQRLRDRLCELLRPRFSSDSPLELLGRAVRSPRDPSAELRLRLRRWTPATVFLLTFGDWRRRLRQSLLDPRSWLARELGETETRARAGVRDDLVLLSALTGAPSWIARCGERLALLLPGMRKRGFLLMPRRFGLRGLFARLSMLDAAWACGFWTLGVDMLPIFF